ncbi:Uncharacterised protein [Achromobacter sp. 2789STDY5608633]|uniref:hypothetical protein n=1 Tax=Achromobacter sp. 2789STDY5608633 TaxID=1806501 RepID=UPI0006C02CD6|nr:hypothetical protein [Achromobacter sp. 2789STDY5608633]CUJ49052.1 Uncharacterised protein [Achromobacter sp. 2789STDY5608633]
MSAFIKSLAYEAHQTSPLQSAFSRAQHLEIVSSALGYFQYKDFVETKVDLDQLIEQPTSVLVLNDDPVRDRIASIAGASLRRDQVASAAYWFVNFIKDFVKDRAPCQAFKYEEDFLAHCIKHLALPHMHSSPVFRDAIAFMNASRVDFGGHDWHGLQPLQDQHDDSWDTGSGYADLTPVGLPAESDHSMATSIGFLFRKLDRRIVANAPIDYWFAATVTDGNRGSPTSVWECGRTPGFIS